MNKFDYVKEREMFNFYDSLKIIVMIFTFFTFLILGIFDCQTAKPTNSGELVYGVMRINSPGACIVVWILFGLVAGCVNYFLTRLIVCYKFLVIANLEKISGIEQQLPQMIQKHEANNSSVFTESEFDLSNVNSEEIKKTTPSNDNEKEDNPKKFDDWNDPWA